MADINDLIPLITSPTFTTKNESHDDKLVQIGTWYLVIGTIGKLVQTARGQEHYREVPLLVVLQDFLLLGHHLQSFLTQNLL